MFPIVLNLTKIPVLLVGQGELLAKRLKLLEEAGATQIFVCHPGEGRDPRLSFNEWLGLDASLRWHDSKIILVAGLERSIAEIVVQQARAEKKLVNVEDVNDLCDFYFTANVRRGDLIIAVSTSGASPTLARKIRDKIGSIFGEEWVGYISDMKQKRLGWKAQGAGFHQLIENAERYLAQKGWLNE